MKFVGVHWTSLCGQCLGADDELSPRTPLIILSPPTPFQIVQQPSSYYVNLANINNYTQNYPHWITNLLKDCTSSTNLSNYVKRGATSRIQSWKQSESIDSKQDEGSLTRKVLTVRMDGWMNWKQTKGPIKLRIRNLDKWKEPALARPPASAPSGQPRCCSSFLN